MGSNLGEIDQMLQLVCAELSPDFELVEIKLFEAGEEVLETEKRLYTDRFHRNTLRYVTIKYEFYLKDKLIGSVRFQVD